MPNALLVAELLGIINPYIRESCYAGWEICWRENEGDELRIVTYVNGGHEFCYTRNANGLNGSWTKQDYWFLYLS